MKVYILRWNPSVSSYKVEDHKNLVMHLNKGDQPLEFNWSIYQWEKVEKDDFFIMQMTGTIGDGIAMIGKFKDKCYEDADWKKDEKLIHYADLWILSAFDFDVKNVLPAEKYEKLFPEIEWHGGHSGVLLEQETGEKILAEIEKDLIAEKIWNENSLEEFKDYKGPGNQRPTQEQLADGKILLSLKKQFLKDRTEDNFVQVICCLHDSCLYVPMKIKIKDKKKEFTADNVTFFPQTLSGSDGVTVFPVFSNEAEAGSNFNEEDCQLLKISMAKCVEYFKQVKECKMLVLDGFTDPFLIDQDLAEMIVQLQFHP